jgi:hypothetical protein
LYAKHPDRFEQYFTDLFLSPTSLVWEQTVGGGGFNQLWYAYKQRRSYLKTFVGGNMYQAAATNVPGNINTLQSLTQYMRDVHHALERVYEFDDKWKLAWTFSVMLSKYGDTVPPALVTRVQELHTMFSDYTMFASLLPLAGALNDIMDQLNACARAYQQVVRSGWKDESAVRELWKAQLFSLLDRKAVEHTPFEDPRLVESQVMNMVDGLLSGWRQVADLPYAPPNENPQLFLRMLKHVYDTSIARGVVVSQEVSYNLVKQLQLKMAFFQTFVPRTAVVYLCTHGAIYLQRQDEHTIRAVKKFVPPNVVVTRVTFAPPGAVTYNHANKFYKFALIVQNVLAADPQAANLPVPFVFSLMGKLYKELVEQELQPEQFEKDEFTYKFFAESFMRPEAVMYLPGDQYLNKKYQISEQERKEGNRGIELISGTHTENLLGKELKTSLDKLIVKLTSPPYNYNNLILIDQTCNVFGDVTTKYDFELLQRTSQALVTEGLLGGER